MLLRVMLLGLLACLSARAQSFDAKEFKNRRDSVCSQLRDGIGIVFGGIPNDAAVPFRQAPDFYYLTGIEDPYGILLLSTKTKKAFVFLPKKSATEIYIGGPGLLEDENAGETYGVTFAALDEFWPYLSYHSNSANKIYLPLSPMDNVHEARDEVRESQIKLLTHPLFGANSVPQTSVKKIQEFCSDKTFADINPILDKLRWVKSQYEIGQLRRSGKIGADGVKESMRGTKPGMFEYEFAAVAHYVFMRRGARGDAFPPIVASGPNTYTIHYFRNDRRVEEGDVILMDYGCDYNYYQCDITRVWPASGKFTADEEKMYACILEARSEIIKALKPGATLNQIKDVAHAVYIKHGFAKEHLQWGKYIGHPVGISVHDVTPFDENTPLVAGVVFNVEPVIGNAARKLHMRLEDTVVITASGAENLTADVPVDLKEIYELVKQKGLESR